MPVVIGDSSAHVAKFSNVRGFDVLKLNMRTRTLQLTAALTVTITASGCATTQANVSSYSGSDAFGDASQQTFGAQIKNPNPVYDHRMVSSGQRTSEAIERYRTDTVKQPTPVRTSNLAIGGSSSDSSGSAGSSPNSTSSSGQAEMAFPTSAKSKSAKPPLDTGAFIPAAGGAIDPTTGKFYPSAGPNGYTDPVTGQYIPKKP